MTITHQDLSTLIEQIRDGSETASKDLVSRYGTHILRIVRHKLNRALRPKFDSQDFVQAVWASFFALLPRGRPFSNPEELIAFLTELAQNKVVDEIRQRLMYKKYNVNREYPLEPAKLSFAESQDPRQPKPDDVAIAREEWLRMLDQQPDLLEMLKAGQSRQEVARALGVSEKTVHRIIDRLAPKVAHESC